jgi:hypothetical protein
MATIFYIRKGSKPDKIASSRDVSVADLISLYGSAPSNYQYMKGVSTPDINIGQGPGTSDSDAAQVIAKIESNEVTEDTFPEEGFYIVKDVRP